MLNLPLAREVYEFISNEPEKVDQSFWAQRDSCGTTACTAGWTVILAGYELIWEPPPSDEVVAYDEANYTFRPIPSTNRTYIPYVAAYLLDLTPGQREELFFAAGTTEKAKSVLGRYIAEAESKLAVTV